jgi:hypothetical protein
LVSEDSAVDVTFALMAGAHARAGEAERERYLKRAGAWIAVALVHVLFAVTLLTAGHVRAILRQQPKEMLLLLPPLHPPAPAQPVRLPEPLPTTPQPLTAPAPTITLPPLSPPATHPQTDVMRVLGKELACGAGSFENLTRAQREACKRVPWHYKKDAQGIIVLDTNPQRDEPISGADAADQMGKTADPCLAAGNTHSECIHKTIFGR